MPVPGKFLGIVGQDPSGSKCNRLHVDISGLHVYIFVLGVRALWCLESMGASTRNTFVIGANCMRAPVPGKFFGHNLCPLPT